MRALLVLWLAAACSGSDCKDMVDKLCARACECGQQRGQCRLGEQDTVLAYDTQRDCELAFREPCAQNVNADVIAQCSKELDTASCVDDALVLPQVCGGAQRPE